MSSTADDSHCLKLKTFQTVSFLLSLFFFLTFLGITLAPSFHYHRWDSLGRGKVFKAPAETCITEKKIFVPQLYRLPSGGSSGAQLWTYLRRGKTCNVRVSCQAVGRRAVATGCCIPPCWGAQGMAHLHPQAAAKSRSSLPQTSLAAGCLPCCSIPSPLCK